MANLLEGAGARPQKEPKFVPLFVDRAFTGLFTQRAPLHDPSGIIESKFYGGRPDSLWMGANIELTNRLTLQRRPGLSPFSTVTYPTAPDTAFSFELANGTIQVIVDTGTTGNIPLQTVNGAIGPRLALTSVAAASGGSTVYTGAITGGGSNAFNGYTIIISGFTNNANNGVFLCTASTTSTLTLANPNGVAEVKNAFADGAAVYLFTSSVPSATNNAFFGLQLAITGFTNASNNGTFTVVASTNLTVTVANSFSISENASANAISSGAVYVDNQNGTKTVLFGKSPGAGQSYFAAVGGVLYIGDGVDVQKYTPLNTNGTVWNWGIAAPGSQPAVQIVPSGSAAVTWVPNTMWSTMGLVYDNTTNSVQQLISVNASTTNTTQFGTSGTGGPNWALAQTPGQTVPDGLITWTNRGPVGLWVANAFYSNGSTSGTIAAPCFVWDPITKAVYIQSGPAGNAGSTPPRFVPGPNGHVPDNGLNWVYMGNALQPGVLPGQPGIWQPGQSYPAYGTVSNNDSTTTIVEPNTLGVSGPPNPGPPYEFIFSSNGGTSGSATTPPPFGATVGTTPTTDGDLIWMSLGSDAWVSGTNYTAWTASGTPFSAIKDSNGNWQVCTTSGKSGSGSHPTWASNYGSITTTDGTDGLVWTCVGVANVWAPNTKWFLPTVGFSPPSSSSPFGGAAIVESGDIQYVTNSGVGENPGPPSWNPIGQYTTDNAALWYNLEVAPTESLSWTVGHVYAYSYKSRSLTDFYTVNVAGTGNPPIPPGLGNPLLAPTGSETNAVSTASPVFTIVGADTGAVNTIGGNYSPDPQVDTIIIWRDADGGGPTNMFELTEIPNIPSQAGTKLFTVNTAAGIVHVDWIFKDFLPDAPTSLYPGLNVLISAPIDDSNDPPATTFLPMVYNFQRIWGAEGQSVNFSGGPDVVTGNPNEAFNPSDELPFLANVVAIVKNSQGLVTFLTDSVEIIAGGPQTASFFSVELVPNVGLLSYNMIDVHAGEIYFFSADNQFYAISPSLNLSRVGFSIGDQFANLPSSGVSDTIWNPATGYVTVHQTGIDNCIMVADGSTGWYRLNPYQTPGGYQGPEPIWSPFASITNGSKMVKSVQTAPGLKKLLVGTLSGPASQASGFATKGVIDLGTAKTYGVLAGTTITNTGSTTITGDLGLSPGSSVTGSPTVTGTSNVDNPAAVQAKIDLTQAYNQAATLVPTVLANPDLGGQTLISGVYSSSSGAFFITSGDLILDAAGNPDSTWVFQTASTLIVANSRSVILKNGALAANVFWQVGSSATIGTSAVFNGTIAALTSITVSTSATTNGGMWAQNGAVTLDTNKIFSPSNTGSGNSITLLGPAPGYQIMYRDLKKFTDNGVQYDANFTMGSIMLVHPGQLAVLKFLEMDFSGRSFRPTVSFLLNEISGEFFPFTQNPQYDPPSIYGNTGVPGSYSPLRYYFSATKSLARARHLQIRVDYGKTSVGDELFNLTVFGRLMSEF